MTQINSPVSWGSFWLSINFYMELLRLKLLFLCVNSHTVFMKIPINFIPPTMSMQSPHSFQITPHLHVLYSVRAQGLRLFEWNGSMQHLSQLMELSRCLFNSFYQKKQTNMQTSKQKPSLDVLELGPGRTFFLIKSPNIFDAWNFFLLGIVNILDIINSTINMDALKHQLVGTRFCSEK